MATPLARRAMHQAARAAGSTPEANSYNLRTRVNGRFQGGAAGVSTPTPTDENGNTPGDNDQGGRDGSRTGTPTTPIAAGGEGGRRVIMRLRNVNGEWRRVLPNQEEHGSEADDSSDPCKSDDEDENDSADEGEDNKRKGGNKVRFKISKSGTDDGEQGDTDNSTAHANDHDESKAINPTGWSHRLRVRLSHLNRARDRESEGESDGEAETESEGMGEKMADLGPRECECEGEGTGKGAKGKMIQYWFVRKGKLPQTAAFWANFMLARVSRRAVEVSQLTFLSSTILSGMFSVKWLDTPFLRHRFVLRLLSTKENKRVLTGVFPPSCVSPKTGRLQDVVSRAPMAARGQRGPTRRV